MPFCTNCGNQLANEAKFCTTCGTPITTLNHADSNQQPVNEATIPLVAQTLIKTYEIPAEVRKQFSKYLSLELHTDRLVGRGGPNGDINYFFKNYMSVTWTPASVATQFAFIVFITPQNASQYVSVNNLNSIIDINKIPFCSGMFSYAPANEYTKALYLDVKAAFDEYKMHEGKNNSMDAAVSSADELKKFKDLLDSGIITQEEFDAKKKQLLGL